MPVPGEVRRVGGVQGCPALAADLTGGAVLDRGGGVQADAAVAVLVVVVAEEAFAERAGIGQGSEVTGERRAYFRVLDAAR